MDTFLIRALQLMLSLSLLVLIHEGGHFLFARLFKIRVEKFCLFFDPWFTIFKFKPKKSDTTYALGWLPLGDVQIQSLMNLLKTPRTLSDAAIFMPEAVMQKEGVVFETKEIFIKEDELDIVEDKPVVSKGLSFKKHKSLDQTNSRS